MGQVLDQRAQIRNRPGGVRGLDPSFELLDGEAVVGERLAEDIDRTLTEWSARGRGSATFPRAGACTGGGRGALGALESSLR